MDDSATLSSAVHVERAMPLTKLHIAILSPPLAQILKETLMMYIVIYFLYITQEHV